MKNEDKQMTPSALLQHERNNVILSYIDETVNKTYEMGLDNFGTACVRVCVCLNGRKSRNTQKRQNENHTGTRTNGIDANGVENLKTKNSDWILIENRKQTPSKTNNKQNRR